MSELKLLPCPFCGGEAAPYHVDQCEDEGEPAAFVMCNLCNAQVPWSPGLGAISAWNRRPTPAASGGDEGAAGASEKEYDYDPVMAAEALTNRIAVGNCETFNLCRSALSDAYDAGRSKAASALSAEREAHERDVRQFSELADANRRRAEAAEADAQAMRAALERSARFVRDELDVRRASMIGPEGTADCPEDRAYIEDVQALLVQIEQALS